MKTLFHAIAVVLMLVSSLDAAETNLPAVKEPFSNMHPGVAEGKTIRAIIPPESVRLIALTENRGKRAPITRKFTPDWDSNQMMQHAFRSDAKAQELSLSATEMIFASYAIVTKDGTLFLLDVLGDLGRSIPITAIILRGDGFGCRFDVDKQKQ